MSLLARLVSLLAWPLGSLAARIALALAAAGGFLAPAGAQELTLAVTQHPLSLPLYVADEQGFFAAEGLRVRMVSCVTGARCMRQLFDGAADVATAARTPIMFSSFERSDFAILGTYGSSEDHKLLTRRGAGIERPDQLRGRRIGVTFGTSGQYFLEAYLLMNGVDPRSVRAVNLAPDALLAAVASGEVEALVAWEPFAWRAMRGMEDGVVALPAEGVHRLSFGLVASRKLVGVRDRELSALLRAVDRALRFIREQPQKARQVLAARTSADMGFAEAVFPALHFRLALEQSLVKTLEAEARWAIREKHVAAKAVPNFLPLLHVAPLRAVAPDAVGALR